MENQEIVQQGFQIASKAAAHIGSNYPEILKVLLFGSVQKGNAHEKSDLDLCLVFPDGTKSKKVVEIKRNIYRELNDLGFRVGEQPGGITLQEISEGELIMGAKRGEFYNQVSKSNTVLYDKYRSNNHTNR